MVGGVIRNLLGMKRENIFVSDIEGVVYPDSYGVYLVGSCLESKDYRDVDVRCILGDEDFEREFPKNDDGLRPRFMLACLSLSAWFRHITGLPVDFQFQKQSAANAKHRGARNALGIYAWTGDAT